MRKYNYETITNNINSSGLSIISPDNLLYTISTFKAFKERNLRLEKRDDKVRWKRHEREL